MGEEAFLSVVHLQGETSTKCLFLNHNVNSYPSRNVFNFIYCFSLTLFSFGYFLDLMRWEVNFNNIGGPDIIQWLLLKGALPYFRQFATYHQVTTRLVHILVLLFHIWFCSSYTAILTGQTPKWVLAYCWSLFSSNKSMISFCQFQIIS